MTAARGQRRRVVAALFAVAILAGGATLGCRSDDGSAPQRAGDPVRLSGAEQPPPDRLEAPTVRQRDLLTDGVAAWQRGDEAGAVDTLQTLRATTTPSAERIEGTRLLAEIHYAAGRYDDAIDALLDLRASAPPDARSEYVLGRAFLGAGMLVEAEDALRRAIRIDPAWIRGYVALQSLLADVGRTEDAEAVVVSLERELYRMAGQLDGETPRDRRLEIVQALGDGVVDPRLARTLTHALDDPDDAVRAAACDALARAGSARVVPTLRTVASSDEDDAVRARATEAIAAIEARAAQAPD